MTEPLDELYLTWLYGQHSKVRRTQSPRTYWKLTRQLFTKEFAWFVPNDDNRAEDGRALRQEFMEESGLQDVDPEWLRLGCSVLEMLVGLSRRLSFEADGQPKDWFWHLLSNVGLNEFPDNRQYNPDQIDRALEMIVWRTYLPSGVGGLFPLRGKCDDQRRVELWYQMCLYLEEHR